MTLKAEKGEFEVAEGVAIYNRVEKTDYDPKIIEVLNLTREILKSGTGYSESLAASIRSFHNAVKTEKWLNKMEREVEELKNMCSGLAERTEQRYADKDNRIRKNDPPEEKEELIKRRATSSM